jgi:hypothetical protein
MRVRSRRPTLADLALTRFGAPPWLFGRQAWRRRRDKGSRYPEYPVEDPDREFPSACSALIHALT